MANTVIGKTKTNIPVQGSDNMSNIANAITADASGNVAIAGKLSSKNDYDGSFTLPSAYSELITDYGKVTMKDKVITISLLFHSNAALTASTGTISIPVAVPASVGSLINTAGGSTFVLGGCAAGQIGPGYNLLASKITKSSDTLLLISISAIAQGNQIFGISLMFQINI